MANGKTPAYLAVLAVVFAVGVLLLWQPYSVTPRWKRYAAPMESYLRAAVRQDSVALARQTLSDSAVTWALHAARAHPQALAVWARDARPSWGLERGDTAIIGLETFTEVCDANPIVLRFVVHEKRPMVAQASSACFEAP